MSLYGIIPFVIHLLILKFHNSSKSDNGLIAIIVKIIINKANQNITFLNFFINFLPFENFTI